MRTFPLIKFFSVVIRIAESSNHQCSISTSEIGKSAAGDIKLESVTYGDVEALQLTPESTRATKYVWGWTTKVNGKPKVSCNDEFHKFAEVQCQYLESRISSRNFCLFIYVKYYFTPTRPQDATAVAQSPHQISSQAHSLAPEVVASEETPP